MLIAYEYVDLVKFFRLSFAWRNPLETLSLDLERLIGESQLAWASSTGGGFDLQVRDRNFNNSFTQRGIASHKLTTAFVRPGGRTLWVPLRDETIWTNYSALRGKQ
jgi:hypothetical protein